MTAELEADMDKIATGNVTKDEVVEISRKMLADSYDLMDEHKRELAEIIWEGMNQDRILGPCPQCREAGRKNEQGEINRLRIIRARKSGKRFVGCEGWREDENDPNRCDQTYGLPQRGDIVRLEETCSICGVTPRVKVLGGRRPWNLCLNEECPSMEEMRRQRAEREAARAAKEAAARRAAEAGGRKADAREPKPSPESCRPAALRLSRVFITFEGIDRSGKTTQARMLAEALGDEAVLVREPGGTPAAERIRDLVKGDTDLSPMTETLLFGAARADLVERVIRPALAAGQDRDRRSVRGLDGRLPGWSARTRDRAGRGAEPVDHRRPVARRHFPARRGAASCGRSRGRA